MIIDDVFSGLDAISEDRIFSRLLGKNGLLRRLGTTVVLVTHATHRLSYADHIIALSSQGTVSEQGSFKELLSNNGYVTKLAARHTVEGDDRPEEPPSKEVVDVAQQNAAADLERPVGSWDVYKYYFTSVGWKRMTIWMGIMVIYSMLTRFPGKYNITARLSKKRIFLMFTRSLD